MLFVVLCPGTPEGSTGSGSGFKASQKTGLNGLKSHLSTVNELKILMFSSTEKYLIH